MAIGIIAAYVLWFNVTSSLQQSREVERLRGYIEFDESDYQQRKHIDWHNEILAIDSSYSWSYYNRGLDYLVLEDYDLAIKDLSRYLLFKPWSTNGHLTLAETYQYRGAYDKAKLHIDTTLHLFKAAGHDPMETDLSVIYEEDYVDYTSIMLERANLYFCAGTFRKAIADFTYCLKPSTVSTLPKYYVDQC